MRNWIYALIIALFALFSTQVQGQSVIINEWSQGVLPAGACTALPAGQSDGFAEWVELLVVGPGAVNLNGYRIRHNTTGAGGLILFEFSNPIWNAVPQGTLIVVYSNWNNTACSDPAFGTGAGQIPDDLVDNDCNFKFVLGSDNPTFLDPSYSTNWWQTGWFDDTQPGSNPALYNGSTLVHDWDQSGNAAFLAATVRPNAPGESSAFTGNSATAVTTATNWQLNTTAAAATPGQPNGGANTTWINSLRQTPNAPTAPNVSRCGPGDVTFTAVMGSSPGAEIRIYTAATGGTSIVTATTSPYLLPITSVSANTSYYVESANPAAGCFSPRTLVTATINPLPSVPIASNVSRCGPGQVTFTANTSPPGDRIRLYTQPTSPVSARIDSSAAPATFTIANVTTTTTYHLESWASTTGCSSATRSTLVVTINNIPPAPPPPPGPLARCGPGVVTFTNALGPPADVLRLYSAATGGSPVSTANAAPYTLSTVQSVMASTSYYLEVGESATGCYSATRTAVPITINPVPTAPTITNVFRCGPGPVTFTAGAAPAAGDELRLYTASTGGTAIVTSTTTSLQPTPDPTTTTTYFLGVTTTATQCESSRTQVTATINAIPGDPTGSAPPICEGSSVTINASLGTPAPSGSYIAFYTVATGGTSIATDASLPYEYIPTPALTTTTTYYPEVVTSAGCTSVTRPAIVVTVNPNPGPLTATPSTVARCGTGLVTFTVTMGTPAGDAVEMYTQPTGGTSILVSSTAPYTLTTPSVSVTTTYYPGPKISATGCVGPRIPVIAAINGNPSAPSITSMARCGDGSVVLTASMGAAPGSDIVFYTVSVGGTSVGAANTSPYTFTTPTLTAGTSPATYTYCAEAVTNTSTPACTSATRNCATVTINPDPSAPIPPTNQVSRCGAGTVSISTGMGAITGTEIRLFSAATGGTQLSADASAPYSLTTPSVTTNTTYCLETINSTTGCSSTTRTCVPVTINDVPAAPSSAGSARCGSGPVTLTASFGTPSGDQMKVYSVSTSGAPVLATISSPLSWTTPSITANTTYYFESVSSTTGCISSTRTPVTASIILPPGPPGASNVVVCGDGATPVGFTLNVNSGTPVSQEVYLYDSPTGPGLISSDQSLPFVLTGTVTTTTTFYIEGKNTTSNPACVSSTRTPVTVTVNLNPASPSAQPVSRCGEGAVTVSAAMPTATPGIQMRLYSVATGGSPLASDNTAPYELTTPVIVNNTTCYLEAVDMVTGCSNSTRTPVTVTINPIPSAPSITNNNLAVCGSGSVTFSASMGATAGDQMRLYSQASGGSPIATDDTGPVFELTSSNISVTTIFYIAVTQSSTGCESSRAPVKATVNSVPSPPSATNVSRCGAGQVTFFAAMGLISGTEIRLYTMPNLSDPNPIIDSNSPYEFLVTPTATTTYYIVSFNSNTNCPSATTQIIATVNDVPGAPTAADPERCGSGTVTVSANMSIPTGLKVRLFTVGAGGDPVDSDITSPFELTSQTITASTPLWIDVESAEGCVSQRTQVNALIKQIPAAPSAASVARCGCGTVTFTASFGNPTGDQMFLYNEAVGGTPIGTAAAPPYTFSSASECATKAYYISSYNSSTQCYSDRTPVSAVINPEPGTPTASSIARCGTGTVTILGNMGTPAASQLRLFSVGSGGTPESSDGTAPFELSTSSISATTTYFMDAYNPTTQCSSSVRRQVVAVVNPEPAPPQSPNGNIEVQRCGVGSVTFTVNIPSAPTGDEVRLFTAATGGTSLASSTNGPSFELTTPAIVATTPFYLESVDRSTSCVSSSRALANAIINQNPGSPTAPNVARCDDGPITFTAEMGTPAGTEISLWDQPSASSSSTTPLATATQSAYTLSQNLNTTTTFYIEAKNTATGCKSQRREVVATLNPSPGPPNVINTPRCGPGPVTFFVSMGSPAGNLVELFSTATPTATDLPLAADNTAPYQLTTPSISTTTVFYVRATQTSTGCTSAVSSVTATINLNPGSPSAPIVKRCGGGVLEFTASMGLPAGTEIRLYTSETGTQHDASDATANDYTLTIPYPIGVTTIFYLEAVDLTTQCASARVPVTAQVDRNPAPPSAPDLRSCGPAIMTFTGSMGSPAGNEMRMYDAAVGGSLVDSQNGSSYELETSQLVTSNTTFYLEAWNTLTGCTSTARTAVIATIFQVPAAPVAINQSRCGQGEIRFAPEMGDPAGNQMRLFTVSTGGIAISTDNTAPYQLITPTLIVSTDFHIEAINTATGCTSARSLVTAIINDIPPDPVIDEVSRCGNGVVTFTAQGPSTGITMKLYGAVAGGSALATSTGPQYLLSSPSINTTSTYYVEATTAANCSSRRVGVRGVIRPNPGTPQFTIDNVARCGEGMVTLTTLMGNPVGDVIRVYTQQTGGAPLAADNAPPYTYETPSLTATTTYWFESYSTSTTCSSGRASMIAIINDIPGLPAAIQNNVSRCGTGVVTFTADMGNPSGSQLRLFPSSTGGTAIATDSNSPYELVTPTLDAGRTFYIESINITTGCSSSVRVPVTATINQNPSAPRASGVSRCGTGPVTISASMGTIPGDQIMLYTAPSTQGIAISTALTSPYLLTTPAMNVNQTLYIFASNSITGCQSMQSSVSVVINLIPGAPVVATTSICGPGKVTFTAARTQPSAGNRMVLYDAATGGNAITADDTQPYELTPTTDITGFSEYWVESVNTVTGCSSARTYTSASVQPLPTAPILGNNGPLCVGESLILTANSVQDSVTYTWKGPNSASYQVIVPNITINPVSLAAQGQYSVTATIGRCVSEPAIMNVVINPVPARPSVQSNSPICEGGELVLSVQGSPFSEYNVAGPNGFDLHGANQEFRRYGLTYTDGGFYSVSAVVAGCTSQATSTEVTVHHKPDNIQISWNDPVCEGENLKISVTGATSAVYRIEGPLGYIATGAGPDFIRANAQASFTGNYKVTASNKGCISEPFSTNVAIRAIPAPPTLTNDSPKCEGSVINFSAQTAVAADVIQWYGPNGFNETGNNTLVPAATAAKAGAYSAVAVVAGCTSQMSTTYARIFPKPETPQAGGNTTLCSGETLTLTTNGVPGHTYHWASADGWSATGTGSSFSRTNVPTGDNVAYTVVSIVSGCTSDATILTVNVKNKPSNNGFNVNSPICSGQTLSLQASAISEPSANYLWEGPNNWTANEPNPAIPQVTTSASGNYYLRIKVGECYSDPIGRPVVITQSPDRPTARNNGPLCVGQKLNLEATAIPGASYFWKSLSSNIQFTTQNPSIPNVMLSDKGNYEVNAIIGGCTSDKGTTVVDVRPVPDRPAVNTSVEFCSGATLTIDVFNGSALNSSGALIKWVGPDGYTATGAKLVRPSIQKTQEGSYSVYATLNGCNSEVAQVNVSVTQTPAQARISSNSPICQGSTLYLTGSIVPNATDYQWLDGNNTFIASGSSLRQDNLTPIPAGVKYTLATINGACTTSATTTVIVNPKPTIINAGAFSTTVCAGNPINLYANADPGAFFTWTGPGGYTNSFPSPTISNATTQHSGIYSVTARIGNCVTDPYSVSVTVSPTPSTNFSAGYNGPLCKGETLLLTSSFVPGATYMWAGADGFSSLEQNPVRNNIQEYQAGDYFVTATIGTCTATASISVWVNPVADPTLPIASNSPVCAGKALNLTAPNYPNGTKYSWKGPRGFSAELPNVDIPAVTASNAGAYTLTIILGSCTTVYPPYSVAVTQVPNLLTVGNNGPLCEGQDLRLTASPAIAGASYVWNGPSAYTATLPQREHSISAGNFSGGTYSVYAMVLGCSSTTLSTNVVLNPAPPSPQIIVTNPVLCVGQTLDLSVAPIPGATYRWTGPNGFSSTLSNPKRPNISYSDAGDYNVNITLNGCSLAVPIGQQIAVQPLPSAPVISTNSPLCEGGTLQLQVPTVSGVNYEWTGPNRFAVTSNNPVRENVTLADGGAYYVTAVSSGGCKSPVRTANVVITRRPYITAGPDVTVCAGQNVNLTASYLANATYSWSGPGFNANVQNPTISNIQTQQSGAYSVVAIIGNCSSNIAITNVTVNPAPSLVTASYLNGPLCEGQTLQMFCSESGASYQWTGPNGFSSAEQNPIVPNVSSIHAGVYSVQVSLGDCYAPLATVQVSIVTSRSTLRATNDGPVCAGQTLNLAATPVPGGKYQWIGPNGFTSTLQNPTREGMVLGNAGAYSVTVTVGSCVSSQAVTIVQVTPAPLNITAINNGPLCAGYSPAQALNLQATTFDNASYTWYGPGGYSSSAQNPTIYNVGTVHAGTYSVVATIGKCQSTVATTTVVVNQAPIKPTVGYRAPACVGGSLYLQGSGLPGATYQWSGPNIFSSVEQNPIRTTASNADAGNYSLVVTINGCTSQAGVTNVVLKPQPTTPVANSDRQTYCKGDSVFFTANSATTGVAYNWSGPNNFVSTVQNPKFIASELAAGIYTLNTFANGCASDIVTLQIGVSVPSASLLPHGTDICRNQAYTLPIGLTGQGPWTIQYEVNGVLSAAPLFNNPDNIQINTNESGTYRLTGIYDAFGCAGSATGETQIVVHDTPKPMIVTANSICAGQNANVYFKITESTPAENWLLTYTKAGLTQPIPTTGTFSGSGNGTFILPLGALNESTEVVISQIKNTSYGCTTDLSVLDQNTLKAMVMVSPLPTGNLTSPNTTICVNGQAEIGYTLTGRGPWKVTYKENNVIKSMTVGDSSTASPFNYSAFVSPSVTTEYEFVTVEDLNSCRNDFLGTMTVQVNPTPTASFVGSSTALCAGMPARVRWNLTGVGPWTLRYTINSVVMTQVVGSASSPSPFAYDTVLMPTSNTTLSLVSIYDSNGCGNPKLTGSYAIQVSAAGVNTPMVGSNSPLCAGQSLQLTASSSEDVSYLWSGPNGFSSTDQNPILPLVEAPAAGTYSMAVVANGCTSSVVTTDVIVASAPTAVLSGGGTSNCGTQAQSVRVDLTGTAPWTIYYTINGGTPIAINGITSSPYTFAPNVPGSGTWNIALAGVMDAGRCGEGIYRGSATIGVLSSLRLAEVSRVEASCTGNGGGITLQASGGASSSYQYSLNGVTNSTGVFTNIPAGTYAATVTDGNCTVSMPITMGSLGAPSFVNTSSSGSSATLTWSAVINAASYTVGYRISGSNATWTEVTSTGTTTTISNLQSGANYEFVVKASCGGGASSGWSTPQVVTIGGSSCMPPTKVAALDIRATTATISWTAPSTRTVCYVVEYAPVGNPGAARISLVPGGTSSASITGLQCNVEYVITVRANCSTCNPTSGTLSNPSIAATFRTTGCRMEGDAMTADVKLYPNPTSGKFNVQFEASNHSKASIQMFDLTGALVHSQSVATHAGLNEVQITPENLSRGMYVVQFQVEGRKFVSKLLID